MSVAEVTEDLNRMPEKSKLVWNVLVGDFDSVLTSLWIKSRHQLLYMTAAFSLESSASLNSRVASRFSHVSCFQNGILRTRSPHTCGLARGSVPAAACFQDQKAVKYKTSFVSTDVRRKKVNLFL